MPCLTQAAMAKLFASEMAERICSDAIRFTAVTAVTDFPVERIYRDVRVCQIYEGSSDIQKILIGRRLASGAHELHDYCRRCHHHVPARSGRFATCSRFGQQLCRHACRTSRSLPGHQPEYAAEIAQQWNVRDSGYGAVTRFSWFARVR